MKKNGFTLAEVLITLGIIGVIAAITLPSLMTDTTSAQIGPKLAKAVSSFEQANQALLSDRGVDTLSDGSLIPSAGGYMNNLSRYLKGSASGTTFTTKDGISYLFSQIQGNFIPASVDANGPIPPHMQRIGNGAAFVLRIDVNGTGHRPDVVGEDIFWFSLWNDGSLRPVGGTNWNGADTSNPGGAQHWDNENNCRANITPRSPQFCAGHIFENNLKVLYK